MPVSARTDNRKTSAPPPIEHLPEGQCGPLSNRRRQVDPLVHFYPLTTCASNGVRCLGVDQSWIDPGAAAGDEAGRAGEVAGAGVAGAARNGAGILDVAFGAGSLVTGGISTGPSSLCGGLSRVTGGLPGGGG